MKTLVATVTLLAALTACGGDGDGRPSTDEIAGALKGQDSQFSAVTDGASDEAISCVAKAVHDSELSDEVLQALVDGDQDYEGSKDDAATVSGLADEMAACLGA